MEKANAASDTSRIENRPGGPKPPAAAIKPGAVPPLFRRVDWLTLVVTFLFVFLGYFLTISPEMTLEDSGELAVASYYAGIPHPPGYPVWTMYTWLWTLLPMSNVAWRVAVGCAFSGALASALLGFVVSRSSSMILESIDDLKNIDRRWENLICLVSGFVAGSLLGFNGYMWSQSVIVEVYPLSVVSLMGVLLGLLRWTYAPHQHRYLYLAFFMYGICFNNHQSLLVIAMGMEVLIWMAEPKLGRELFFWNTVIYLAGVASRPDILWANVPVRVIFNIIGISSLLLYGWLFLKTDKTWPEFGRDILMLAVLGFLALFFGGLTSYAPSVKDRLPLVALGGIGTLVAFFWAVRRTSKLSREWLVTLGCGGSWLFGAAFYLFMPIAGAANPPLQWGYPRTLDGFIHAITRGQYEKIKPTSGSGDNAFEVVGSFIATFSMQLWRFLEGLNDEFNILYLLMALVVFLFIVKMKRRERAWLIGMIAMFICLGPFLVLLLNFSSDRQSLELNRVFLTSAHVFVAASVGYGLALLAASMLAHYNYLRRVSILGGICAVDFALYILAVNSQMDFDPDWAARYGFIKIFCWLLAISCVIAFWGRSQEVDRKLIIGLPAGFVAASALLSLLAFVGYPFNPGSPMRVARGVIEALSPNHYGLHVYAALFLLVGGALFLCATLAFRSKAPLGLTLVLFALMPSYSILTHWFDNEQKEHWFGYWFGHDMFTPPFVGPDGKLTYDAELRKAAFQDPERAKLTYPEMARDTILFGGTDPGRFAPTYMIFCDSFIPDRCKPVFDQKFDRRDVYIITQNALADGTYLNYIRAHYFRSDQLQYDTPFFQQLLRGPKERDPEYNYETNFLARLAYQVLDAPIAAFGASVEARRRREGVYPPEEIYTPTPEDSGRCFKDYLDDAQRRLLHDQQHPNEPRQIKPGELVTPVMQDGQMRVQVSGQVSVMSINGLLTKVIFDNNPTNEFYVEESFPLDWMFPHLTPFGIIMKINRQPIPEITEDIVRLDHEFWAKYSERLIGNWITNDTPVSNIVNWAEKVYLRRDYSDFTGDRKFARDDNGQKAFSKLRSSIGGIYAWRLGLASGTPTPPQYLPKTEAVRLRMIKEAEFALQQAFAFCPYSPEAVYRYVNLLMSLNRLDDALLIAKTCSKLDPFNGQITGLVRQLEVYKSRPDVILQIQGQIADLEKALRANPNDFQKAWELLSRYIQIQQTDRATQVLDGLLENPLTPVAVLQGVAQAYIQLNNLPKVEATLERLVKVAPNDAEAWFNLARAKAHQGKKAEAAQALEKALQLNASLRSELEKDPILAGLRAAPELKPAPAPK